MFALVTIVVLFGSSVYAETAVTCDGFTLTLNCSDNEIIHIISADYGRSSLDICPITATNQSTNCTDKNSTLIIAGRCNDEQNCSIPVNSTLFGDPCPGTSKYLSVNYTCFNRPPVFCGINEHHTICGSNCQESCNGSIPESCIYSCIFNQCVCNLGYVRDPATNVCILKNFCPLPGNSNETHEVFTQCGGHCEPTCTHRRSGFLCGILSPCQPGYICDSGYLRLTETGQCVLPSECPRQHRRFWSPWDF